MRLIKRRYIGMLYGVLLSISVVACLPTNRPPSSIEPTQAIKSPITKLAPTLRSAPVASRTPRPTLDPRTKYEGDCVFCFLDGSNPLEPVWDSTAGGFTYNEGDPRDIIVIDENFGVEVGQSVIFENKIVLIQPTQRKDIEVYGTLTIKDSLLIWQQTEYQQTRLQIKNGGVLIVEDSFSFWGNQYWVNWEFEDGSTIYFDHFIGDPWCSTEGSVKYTAENFSTVKLTIGNDTHDTSVQISDAHHVWLELFPSAGTHIVKFPYKREWADWYISNLWPNSYVEIQSSYIYERDISLSNNTHVTIQDTPSGFSMGWAISKDTPGYVECELKGLGEPGNADGVFYEDTTWDLPCNNSSLTVKNSLLQRAWPVTWGWVHLMVYDSFLVDVRNYGAPATMELYNSSIDIVAAYKGGLVYVEHSRINEAAEVKDQDSVIYSFSVSGDFELLESDGGTYIELDTIGPPWE